MNELVKFIKKDIPYHFLLSGASEQIIEKCEKTLNIKLPSTYIEFLKFSNGALIYEADELFGTEDKLEGIGSLLTSRNYKIAEFLPTQFILFHDNGFECHAFDTFSKSEKNEYKVVQWNWEKQVVLKSYLNLSQWVKSYLAEKWS